MNWDDSNLDKLPDKIWEALEGACGKPQSPLRTPAFASTNQFETAVRTVVLRRAERAERRLTCFADVRSTKIRELKLNSQAQWLFYHPVQRVQIRATAQAFVYNENQIAREFWERMPLKQRVGYCATESPGSPLAEPGDAIPAALRSDRARESELETGYQNFAVIVTEVDQFEWLRIGDEGHRRAVLRWSGEKYSGFWLVP